MNINNEKYIRLSLVLSTYEEEQEEGDISSSLGAQYKGTVFDDIY